MTVPKVRRKKARSLNKLRVCAYIGVISLCMLMAFYLHSNSGTASTSSGAGTGAVNNNGSMTKKNSQSIRGSNGSDGSGSGGSVGTKIIPDTDAHVNKSAQVNPGGSATKDIPSKGENLPKSITLKTTEGDIVINLRPDLSLPSVQYIQRLLDDPSPCTNCRFYRAEKPGILQGILVKKNVKPNKILGECPEEMKGKKHDCPPHDPNCGCHGPIMKKGMIAWAAGKGGPDFFIDSYERPAKWWNTDHTVFGEVADDESMGVVMSMYQLPATKKSLTMLDVPVHFEISSP
eukprot:CAMPEP_0203662310 /NCGR_PEP_ID=MMETSP0090-20130426/319_1 /ASSEMBLY_ACC=CAM_ASM_001088 /TAXON_ID=426623 /ORGANISM="Chaetoceros affinis, Strain CCMP159" /LENGTH=288 /DNA_ID=CAMNT_0050525075 /DNA_START=18 /DNA_END=884 /DNA_ORIENTATION=+